MIYDFYFPPSFLRLLMAVPNTPARARRQLFHRAHASAVEVYLHCVVHLADREQCRRGDGRQRAEKAAGGPSKSLDDKLAKGSKASPIAEVREASAAAAARSPAGAELPSSSELMQWGDELGSFSTFLLASGGSDAAAELLLCA
mmetsp:Transcript_10485/g.32816  ORF Transcript_10485/g.32816 Transcript_10485/m.32816 type:complete len:144 (+) Transcript_10485:3-434(+)